MINYTQDATEEVRDQVIEACKRVHGTYRGRRLDYRKLQDAISIELAGTNYHIKCNYEVVIRHNDRVIGNPEKINMVIDGKVGLCIVRGREVTNGQRDRMRLRIEQAGLISGLVATFDGPRISWKRIDVPGIPWSGLIINSTARDNG